MKNSTPPRSAILQVENMSIRLAASNLQLLGPVGFTVSRGEIFGIVGESGSGKTLTGLAISQLLPAGMAISGRIVLDGEDIVGLSEREMRRLRGRSVAMVFQEPTSALNPVFTIGEQIVAVLLANRRATRSTARAQAIALLDRVGIPDAARRMSFYPSQFSGGMCQRIMIALALATGARLLIADEPTTALDVTIQDQIVALLAELVREEGLTIVFISHDLGLVSTVADRVAVFYAGTEMELGSSAQVIEAPQHPYSQRLVGATPRADSFGEVLRGIAGQPPLAGHWDEGCRFRGRCHLVRSGCEQPQPLRRTNDGRDVRCLLVDAPAETEALA